MNTIEKIFLAVGKNPKAFFIGWCSAIISIILGVALWKIIF